MMSAEALKSVESTLRSQLGRPLELTLTDNVRSMISFREEPGRVNLRLHHMFTSAPHDVLSAVAEWINNPGAQPGLVRHFMRENRLHIRPRKERDLSRIALRPDGKVHHLDRIFAALNARYFHSRLEMRITWGRKGTRRRPRTVRLGAWYEKSGLITISPRLDRTSVPRYFIEFVVYHEMLHAALGIEVDSNGRRHAHTPVFRTLEKQFYDYDRANAFELRFSG